MSELIRKIQDDQAIGFTHGGKFHADDVFASALLLHLNPDIEIKRGNKVPEDFEGIVYDIGRGAYDHHQRDSRIRENGVPYAAFGLLWEELGAGILGEELAVRFDEEFVQPLDLNDNTGEKNELASLIGDFNPTWDDATASDLGFFQAVSFAEMILDNKFAKYKSNEKADLIVSGYIDEACATKEPDQAASDQIASDEENQIASGLYENGKVLVLAEFVPFQKKLSETDIAFAVFPSNRGGFCIQPIKKPNSMNYRCGFPDEWLGLDNTELQQVSGIATAQFCHKGGFIMTVTELEDAIKACHESLEAYVDHSHYVIVTENEAQSAELKQLLHSHLICNKGIENGVIDVMYLAEPTQIECNGYFGHVDIEKQEWKQLHTDIVDKIRKRKPEAVLVEGSQLVAYPLIHQLRKKKIPVYVPMTLDGEKKLIRIPSGS